MILVRLVRYFFSFFLFVSIRAGSGITLMPTPHGSSRFNVCRLNLLQILDGSDVLQQISNLTSTEPSNEREVQSFSHEPVILALAFFRTVAQ